MIDTRDLTYKSVAKIIKENDLSEEQMAAIIKLLLHQEKYSVYHMLSFYCKEDDFLKNILEMKVKTHKDLKGLSLEDTVGYL